MPRTNNKMNFNQPTLTLSAVEIQTQIYFDDVIVG